MSDTFLTIDEIAELSGIRTGRKGKNREELQVAWLRTSGIPFWTNARGRPIVARAAIEGRKTAATINEPTRKAWVPRVLSTG